MKVVEAEGSVDAAAAGTWGLRPYVSMMMSHITRISKERGKNLHEDLDNQAFCIIALFFTRSYSVDGCAIVTRCAAWAWDRMG